jgi:hypothetical protein
MFTISLPGASFKPSRVRRLGLGFSRITVRPVIASQLDWVLARYSARQTLSDDLPNAR